ncbi:hypothetical protein EIN_467900 [Entamoeba invadens IP1]|uniref:RWP-RK domain-containing protein n=1 Tax=Entamoeba invadens IP1 TaxID=370355 RepID=A0A0A1TYR8_ENTIV|nr:hypothetical protein EIN_467900 [Entamoeba invadens IP1]ELP83676.1 hypothetical protein EIN_467900 [Entamoeba invadens IP1]|eukprot:XP_004183022.1 hypothetical protein EIN_467900 [Entamoeba invadens IP1]
MDTSTSSPFTSTLNSLLNSTEQTTEVTETTQINGTQENKNQMSIPEVIEAMTKLYEYPEDYVVEKLGITTTLLKKACRSIGVKRWPYRKILKVDREIQKNETILKKEIPIEEKDKVQEKIARLKELKDQILFNPNTDTGSRKRKPQTIRVPAEMKRLAVSCEGDTVPISSASVLRLAFGLDFCYFEVCANQSNSAITQS